MKTMQWSMAVLLVLFAIATMAVTFAETDDTAAAGTKSWRVVPIAAMSMERAAHQATLLETGQVLVTGGCAGSCDRIHASAELYDPASKSFRSSGEMKLPRASHAANLLPDGRVLVAGGWNGREVTASAEIYDPMTGRFTSAGEMVEARMGIVGTALSDGRVLLTGGGSGAMGLTPLASAEIFDPATLKFSTAGQMQAPRSQHVAVALKDGRVLVTGGHRIRGGGILRSAEIFDPVTGKFQPTGDMTVARHKHAAVLLANGKVLIVGGSDDRDYRGRYASTEIYDPASGGFSPGPDMRLVRHKLRDAVVLLPSGEVLVAGGAVNPELFDPVNGNFVSVAGELSGPQMFVTASLLPGGDVLIIGGYGERIRSSASAWLVTGDAVKMHSADVAKTGGTAILKGG